MSMYYCFVITIMIYNYYYIQMICIRKMPTLKLHVYRRIIRVLSSIRSATVSLHSKVCIMHVAYMTSNAVHLVAPALFSDVNIGFRILARKAVGNSVIYYVVINEVRHTHVIFY